MRNEDFFFFVIRFIFFHASMKTKKKKKVSSLVKSGPSDLGTNILQKNTKKNHPYSTKAF